VSDYCGYCGAARWRRARSLARHAITTPREGNAGLCINQACMSSILSPDNDSDFEIICPISNTYSVRACFCVLRLAHRMVITVSVYTYTRNSSVSDSAGSAMQPLERFAACRARLRARRQLAPAHQLVIDPRLPSREHSRDQAPSFQSGVLDRHPTIHRGLDQMHEVHQGRQPGAVAARTNTGSLSSCRE
jgi:hypothetical protein